MQQPNRWPSSVNTDRAKVYQLHGAPCAASGSGNGAPVVHGLACGSVAPSGAPGEDTAAGWRRALGQLQPEDLLALAIRLPVCPQTCWHCSNTPRLQGTHSAQAALLQAVAQEISLAAAAGAARGEVVDLHFTGGSANIVGAAALQPLVQAVRTQLRVTPSATWSLVSDPRACTPDELSALRAMGFDTLTLNVGDLDGAVQAGIGRLLSLPLLDDVMRQAWRLRWRQVQIDLVCGLPGQHPRGWLRTLQAVLALGPTRIRCRTARRDAVAHPAQRSLARDAWPEPETLPALCAATVQRLGEAGYQPLTEGLWVLEDDPWLRETPGRWPFADHVGQHAGPSLQRLAFGPGGRSRVAGWEVLNEADPAVYVDQLAAGRAAVRALRALNGQAMAAAHPLVPGAPGASLH